MDNSLLFGILTILAVVHSIFVVIALNKKIKKAKISSLGLSKFDIFVAILSSWMSMSVTTCIILFFGLRKKYPNKAKSYFKIGIIFFIVEILVYALVLVLIIPKTFKTSVCPSDFLARHEHLKVTGDIEHCSEKNFLSRGLTRYPNNGYCKISETESFDPEICIVDVVKATQDIKICDSLDNLHSDKDWFAPTECFKVIDNLTDSKKCDSLKIYQDDCVVYVATVTNDLQLCLSAKIQKYSSNCLTPIAIKNKNINICSSLVSASTRSSCYSEYLTEFKSDSTECKKITNPDYQKECQVELRDILRSTTSTK